MNEEELWRKRVSSAPAREARASSTLAAQGRYRYEAANAVDGKKGTAWCSAHRNSGVGEWIEVSVNPKADPFSGITMIPGYGRDSGTFRRNNRVLKLHAADCADPEHGIDVDLRSLDLWPGEDAPPDVTLRANTFRVRPMRCVRITLIETAQGPDNDTCISEILPVILPK